MDKGLVGRKIKKLRKGAGLTLKELAGSAGISIGFLGDIESGRANPSIETLSKLAKALNTTTDSLLDYHHNDLRLPAGAAKIKHSRLIDSIMRAKELPEDNVDQIADALEALIEHHRRKTKKSK